ncbi:MAG: CTP synthase, partial [Propionibacteriales bacterium]|nr:CTP synthase [Propionibacteriales bacterium]
RNVPFFGICLGMQCAVMEFARHVAGMADANSTEFNEKTSNPVIDLMDAQRAVTSKGGTMRLGSYPCRLGEGTRAREAYGTPEISERHRHRYEVNNAYRDKLEQAGLVFSGTSPDNNLVEYVELPAEVHPYYVSTQAHPELRSRPTRPHPLFAGLVGAAITRQRELRIPIDETGLRRHSDDA